MPAFRRSLTCGATPPPIWARPHNPTHRKQGAPLPAVEVRTPPANDSTRTEPPGAVRPAITHRSGSNDSEKVICKCPRERGARDCHHAIKARTRATRQIGSAAGLLVKAAGRGHTESGTGGASVGVSDRASGRNGRGKDRRPDE